MPQPTGEKLEADLNYHVAKHAYMFNSHALTMALSS